MPTIDDLKLKNRSKKFEKISYRPWEFENNNPQGKPTNPITDRPEPENKLVTQETTSHEVSNDFAKILRSLFGIQKNIMFFLCNKISHEDNHYAYTFAFSAHDIVDYTRSTKNSIASSLLRLKQKNLIATHENKPGRGGFASYKLDKELCKFLRKNSINN